MKEKQSALKAAMSSSGQVGGRGGTSTCAAGCSIQGWTVPTLLGPVVLGDWAFQPC